jgi:hypothetical protein
MKAKRCDEAVQRCGLARDARFPIRVDKMVEGSELVIKLGRVYD